MILLLVFLPLAAALIAGLGNRMLGDTLAKSVTTGALFVSAALSWVVFADTGLGHGAGYTLPVLDWIDSGDLHVAWAFKIDALTSVMLVVITTVSALVHLYSWGYMAEDPDQPRFFAYLSLFTFAMLMLVTADNLVQMFLRLGGGRPRELPADRLLVLQGRAPTPPRSRRSSSTASATSASRSASSGRFSSSRRSSSTRSSPPLRG